MQRERAERHRFRMRFPRELVGGHALEDAPCGFGFVVELLQKRLGHGHSFSSCAVREAGILYRNLSRFSVSTWKNAGGQDSGRSPAADRRCRGAAFFVPSELPAAWTFRCNAPIRTRGYWSATRAAAIA